MLINRFEPGFHVGKRKFVGDIESDDDAVGLLVEGVSDRLEALLSSGVPNLYCDILGVW